MPSARCAILVGEAASRDKIKGTKNAASGGVVETQGVLMGMAAGVEGWMEPVRCQRIISGVSAAKIHLFTDNHLNLQPLTKTRPETSEVKTRQKDNK